MIKNLIATRIPLERIAEKIKTLDMTAQVKQLIADLDIQHNVATAQSRRAAIMNMTNPHTGTITLHCTSVGNISIKAPASNTASSQLYSVPGQSILFALDQPFEIQQYTLKTHQLEKTDTSIIDNCNPLIIDGNRTLFDYSQRGEKQPALIGRINFPDRSADINVFDPVSLRKTAWLPQDNSTARYLLSLELLETIQDPEGVRVAGELIYHYHPAVAWKAFQMLYRADPQNALSYVPSLKKRKDARLDNLLRPLELAA
ncbi:MULTISPECIES: hypothetical protein [unclassified Pseudomonas]|uniref:hypothetical protein n=1 Tax=unclassified Pseudomonas TaxID=196821 RepID=UPI001CC0658A|nr:MULTISPECIES: hypothetical protein [unclassified Pseudomonas]